jgi:succinate dehydrogenase / fumarate reductase iron-sulfur subunit
MKSETQARRENESDAAQVVKEVTFRIARYIPDDGKVFTKEYRIPVRKGMTVLEGLIYIKEHLDSSLSWRSSCRMAVCGSCAMFIDRFPMLACNTQILELEKDMIEVAPLPNFDNMRDLVPDLMMLIDRLEQVRPHIIRNADPEEIDRPTGEFLQSEEELMAYLQYSYCIKCGACLAACPTLATDSGYIGPQALTQALRYSVDSRDDGLENRRDAVDVTNGPWKCHFAGACSEACPKGVDPAMGVQLLKRALVMGLKRRKGGAPVVQPDRDAKRREGVPDAPKPTVG